MEATTIRNTSRSPDNFVSQKKRTHLKRNRNTHKANANELFETGLKEIYWSKRILIRLLDKMIRNSTSQDLADILEEHQVIAHRQTRRIEDIFSLISVTPKISVCYSFKEIADKILSVIDQRTENKDAEFVSAILDLQNHCCNKYKALRDIADSFEEDKIKILLEQTQLECELIDNALEHTLEISHEEVLI